MTDELVSIVIPVYNEAANIAPCLRGLTDALRGLAHEILVCYDAEGDTTLPAIAAMEDRPPAVRLVKNDLGPGVAMALRAGFAAAAGDVVVTTMADLSDPPGAIPAMVRKIREEGAAVVSGSRYMKGGSQTGGPRLKRFLSRLAGLSLHHLAWVNTHDATTNFRAYRREFLQEVPIESRHGFEVALELTVKAHLRGFRVDEVPCSWNDRSAGESRFRLRAWLPRYLHWYGRAMIGPLFVGIVLLAASMAAFFLAFRHAPVAPFWDDWIHVPVVAGQSPPTWGWLWGQHNEHRIPLPKLIGLVLHRGSGMNAAWGTGLNALVLMTASLLLLRTLAKSRGRPLWTDAFVPLLLLHWGHWENLTWPFQIGFVLPVLLLSAVLFAMRTSSPGAQLLGGAGLLALPLCGAPGLPFVVLLSPAWLIQAFRRPRSAAAWASIAMAAASLALTAFYFIGYQRPVSAPARPGVFSLLDVALCSLTGSLGYLGEALWPVSGVAAVAGGGAAAVWLAKGYRARPESVKGGALPHLLLGTATLALMLGYGRGGLSPYAGFIPRYATLTCLFPFIVYASADLAETAGRRWIRTGLLLLGGALYATNAVHAWGALEERRRFNAALISDVRAGLPIPLLASRQGTYWYPWPDGTFERGMETLAQARLSVYRTIPPPAPSLLDVAARNGATMLLLENGRVALELRAGTAFRLPVDPERRSFRFEVGLLDPSMKALELRVLRADTDAGPLPIWSGSVTGAVRSATLEVEAGWIRVEVAPDPLAKRSLGWILPALAPNSP